MKTRDRPNFRKKLVKTTTISVAVLVAAIMIISAIPTIATPVNTTRMNKIEEIEPTQTEPLDPAGLHPATKNKMMDNSQNVMTQPFGPLSDDGFAYACNAQALEVNKWPLDDPGGVETIADGDFTYFLAGGTWTCDEEWFGCEYNTGGLWKIDPDTGEQENIGGGGTVCNGLAWDPVYNRLYGAGSGLYEYDPETGEQEYIGSHGISQTIISLVIDMEGVAWAYDVKFSGNAKLYNIDLETGKATEVADMGANLCWAQDGAYDRDTNTMYLAACNYGGSFWFAYWDWDAEEIVDIGNLNAEYACAMIRSPCIPPEHDVGVKAILKPTTSGHAIPEMEMELLVKNYGNNTETFDAQMEIIKCEDSGEFLFEEYFDGGVMPENWTTDYWTVENSNMASGTAPEARVYKYDQYYDYQYYDNYIQTAEFDATGWEKLTMTFRWASDLVYPQYTNFYVKWRRNDTSPWKDLSPWENPLGSEADGDLYEIDCYGFGTDLGKNFSILFQYVGYYYYFNYFYLDDIKVEGCGGCAEYAELEEDISLAPGEETVVVFPGWPPSEWHNESFQDTWEAYPVHGFTIMEGDQRPRNNDKWHLLELYYPFFYDIEITEIGEPSEGRSIPGRIFDVEATITNVGQFPSCCIGIDIDIGQDVLLGSFVNEGDWDGDTNPYGSGYWRYFPGYDNGWRDQHKNLVWYYGWRHYTYGYAGGENSDEAYLPYYYARPDYKFTSGTFDASGIEYLDFYFKYYINHYSGSGLYALEAGYSHDGGATWNTAWHEEPSATGTGDMKLTVPGDSATMQIGFWIKGNQYYFNAWAIDDVYLEAIEFDLEYSDFMCQGDDLEPGESRVFYFDQWTPEALLSEETQYNVRYRALCSIDVEVDQDLGNNLLSQEFACDYWHDCGIDRVSNPADIGRSELLWQQGPGDIWPALSSQLAENYPFNSQVADDFQLEDTSSIETFVFWGGFWNGAPVNPMDVKVHLYQDDGGKPTGSGMSDPEETALYSWEIEEVEGENVGGTYYKYTVELDPPYVCEGGEHYWIVAQSWLGFPPQWGWAAHGEEVKLDTSLQGFPVLGLQFWTDHGYGDVGFELYGSPGGAPGIKAYIQPSTQAISAVAKNYGTFKELDLICDAEILEFITDPENGTSQYTAQVTDIDLEEPLGGEVPLDFGQFTFAYEGRYGLFMLMPDDNDDFNGNNKMSYGIGVDDTKPVSNHTLTPPIPDGENGWYVNDLEVLLQAMDPVSMDVSSGVDMIKYKINDGAEQTIDGDGVVSGTFLITQAHDKDDAKVEYWAVDNVGNEESHHTFTVDMDQTDPTVDLTYEVVSGNPIQGWLMRFTATCTDLTSGMDRVEFFMNAGHQSTVSGSGPTYQWEFNWFADTSIDIRADAYDIAGNMAFDLVEDPITTDFSYNQQQTIKILQS
jgi:hypothetical protein